MKRFLGILLFGSILLAACGNVTPTMAPAPVETSVNITVASPTQPEPVVEPELYVSMIWHQHQPFYATDPETGLVAAPWVRLHAAKDYVDMVKMLEEFPEVHATFNLTPSLIKQLDDLAAGKRDLPWEMTLVPASELTEEQKTYLLLRFFDTNGKVIALFPRYEELMDKRGGTSDDQISAALDSWTTQDFLDLQVLFNLAWTDPDYLAEEPLAGLVSRGSNFTEEDKQAVLDVHLELVKQVITAHAEMQAAGQIEVTTTPYAHPILPLLIDTDLAKIAVPDIVLPTRFSFGRDAVEQLRLGVEQYQSHFGQPPRGMWPAEGSVAEEIIGPVYRAGIQWILTDESILAKSIEADFTRDANGLVAQPELLYRPYNAADRNDQPVAIFFRDTTLSNKVSFDYSQIPSEDAIADFIGTIHKVRDAVKDKSGGPYVMTIILDGENAWEWYDNDGKDFLKGMYAALSADRTLKLVTPSEFLALNKTTLTMIDTLFAGSWDGGDFKTWIGEQEENKAWGYLSAAREVYEEYARGSKKAQISDSQLETATEALLAAEGSDWFWWFGDDKDSGNDSAFDVQFRETLGQMYDAFGVERPEFLSVPVIYPVPVEPQKPLTAVSSPAVDGIVSNTEWDSAGTFTFNDAGVEGVSFAFSKDLMTLRIDSKPDDPFSIYFKVPAIQTGSAFSSEGQQVLGMDATHRLEVNAAGASLFGWDGSQWVGVADVEIRSSSRETFEVSFPHDVLWPTLDAGDALLLRIATTDQLLPEAAPGRMLIPDLGRIAWTVEVLDPANDDHGPGNYTYPTDGVFVDGVLDLVGFKVGSDENNLVFLTQIRGPIENPWGSSNGLSIQTVDIYIDIDGPVNGTRMLRNARNTALTDKNAWDFALTVAGWYNGFFTAAEPEKAVLDVPLTIITDPGKRTIMVKIPKAAIPGDPEEWQFAVAVYSQDGYGPNNIREVLPVGESWRVGGAPEGVTNYTRIMDYLWPAGSSPTQEEMLAGYTPQTGFAGDLGADDFPQVWMVQPE